MCKTILILAVLLQLCFNGVVQFGNSTRLLKQNFDVDVKNIMGTEANVKHGHRDQILRLISLALLKKIKY